MVPKVEVDPTPATKVLKTEQQSKLESCFLCARNPSLIDKQVNDQTRSTLGRHSFWWSILEGIFIHETIIEIKNFKNIVWQMNKNKKNPKKVFEPILKCIGCVN